MTRLPILLATCLICISCADSGDAFVQGGIRIVLPVKQSTDSKGAPIVEVYKDGGTEMFRVTDATGKEFDIYLDNRLREAVDGEPLPSPGTIYLNAYPESPGSVRVENQDLFKKQILKAIGR